MTAITVEKRNERGEHVWTYKGEITAYGDTWVCYDAHMARDLQTDYVHFRIGDLMTEYHYADRWYNVFRIQDVDSQVLKGWYCNITRPAQIDFNADPVTVSADDMALDVFVGTDGRVLVLDEDEFADISMSDDERAACWAAVEQIRALVATKASPFHEIV